MQRCSSFLEALDAGVSGFVVVEDVSRKPTYGSEIFKMKMIPIRGICRVRGCRNISGDRKALCLRHDAIVWRSRHPVEAAYKALGISARKRRIPFNLTLDQFRDFIEGTGYLEKKGRIGDALQVDRINPRLGYQLGNIQVITATENLGRREISSGARWRLLYGKPASDQADPDDYGEDDPF